MKILVSTPYSLDSLSGNTVSANRIASILTEAGCEAVVISANEADIEGKEGDALIALHARKSAEAVWKYRELYSNRKILLFLTGTDLYEDIPNGCEICEKSMQIADYLIVSQSASLASVPERFRAKARVVRKSIALPDCVEQWQSSEMIASPPSIVIASHLREVKQPFLVCEALALLPELDVKVELLGRVIDDGYGEMAKEWMEKDVRFHWIEDCPHLSTLEKMATATATLNTSLLEGGANSVGESVVLGTPVLASEIEGNIGLLGEGYTGYFKSGSAQNLANLLEKLVKDANFYQTLKQQITERQAEFSREAEKSDWLILLE